MSNRELEKITNKIIMYDSVMAAIHTLNKGGALSKLKTTLMMAWAKYLIFAVRHDVEDASIEKVKCIFWDGNKWDIKEATKSQVIKSIQSGYKFKTIILENNQFKQGEDVRVVTSKEGNEYLRTDANDIEEDNLGELPAF